MTDPSTLEPRTILGCPVCGRLWASGREDRNAKLGDSSGICLGGGTRHGDVQIDHSLDVANMYVVDTSRRPKFVWADGYALSGPVTTLVSSEERANLWALAKLFHAANSGSNP